MAWLLIIQIVGVTVMAARKAKDGASRGLASSMELTKLMRNTAMLNRQKDRKPVLREIKL